MPATSACKRVRPPKLASFISFPHTFIIPPILKCSVFFLPSSFRRDTLIPVVSKPVYLSTTMFCFICFIVLFLFSSSFSFFLFSLLSSSVSYLYSPPNYEKGQSTPSALTFTRVSSLPLRSDVLQDFLGWNGFAILSVAFSKFYSSWLLSTFWPHLSPFHVNGTFQFSYMLLFLLSYSSSYGFMLHEYFF